MENGSFATFCTDVIEVYRAVLQRHLNAKGVPEASRSSLSKEEIKTVDVFVHFSEISNSLDRLREIALLLRSAPPKSSKISKVSYLKFLVESHLQELYILRERLRKCVIWLNKNTECTSLR